MILIKRPTKSLVLIPLSMAFPIVLGGQVNKRTYTRFIGLLKIILIAKNKRFSYIDCILTPSKLKVNFHDPCSAKTQKIN